MRSILPASISIGAAACVAYAIQKLNTAHTTAKDCLLVTENRTEVKRVVTLPTPADQLSAMLAEYNTLRSEILQAMSNRIKIVIYTFTALSVVLTGLLSSKVSDVLAGTISLFIVPQVAKAGMLIWLGEYHRVWRAGRWIAALEKRMNKVVSLPGALSWESLQLPGVKDKPQHEVSVPLLYPAAATILLTLVPGYIGSTLGAGLIFDFLAAHFTEFFGWVVVAIIAVYVVILEMWFIYFFRVRWKRARYGVTRVAET